MKHEKFLSILTRCRDEFFVKEWVDYYLSQGVDSIYIVDDDSEDKSIYDFASNREYENVNIIYEKRNYANTTTAQQWGLDKNSPSNKIFKSKIRGNYKWMIYCDVDEFIVTKKHFNLTIRERLQKIENNVASIAIPWVFMSGAKFSKNPKSVLREVVYRHDHDKKHPHPVGKFRCRYDEIEYKTIFKPSEFEYLRDHEPIHVGVGSFVNGCSLKPERIQRDTFRFLNLRNKDIETGEFLCYHYRYISDEYAKNKLSTNGWYINDGYSFEDLKSSSYPEIYDDTLLRKMENDK